MKILINIVSDDFLRCHEALSLAFAMAAFDHEIQLYLDNKMVELLVDDPLGKLAKMIQSLEMYDISPAWMSTEATLSVSHTSPAWLAQVQAINPLDEKDLAKRFDLTLNL